MASTDCQCRCPADVTSIGSPEGEWVPLGGLTPTDLEAKAAQNWVYGRTPADKEQRRSVVTDLYLYDWDGCKDQTLQGCLQKHVDGVDDGSKAPGILIPSSELTATRDQLGADASPPCPDSGDFSSCLQLTVSDCIAKLKVSQAKDKDRETKRDASTLTEDLAQELIPKIVSIEYSDTDIVPVEVMGQRMESPDASNDKDPNNNVTKGSQLNQCTTKLEYPKFGHGVDPQAKRNEWLMQAWKVVSDPKPDDADRTKPEWTDTDVVGCFPWAARVINEIEKQYLAGTLVYDDPNFIAPNAAPKLTDGEARNKLIAELYAHGGCGDAALTDGATAAPDGTWSLETCRQELNVPEGAPTEPTNADLGPAQLQVAVALARDAYTANRPPDWGAEVFQWADMSAGGSPNLIVPPETPALDIAGPQPVRWPCDQFSARVCAIMKTPITGPSDSAGAPEMVKPTYPTRNDATGETILGDAPSATVAVDTADADRVNTLKADGYLWATPEVKAAVARLDEARHAAQGGQARYEAPDNGGTPVNWIINKDGTTAAVSDFDKAELHRRLDTGWVWGYTDAEKEDRAKLVDSLYAYGGCQEADNKQLTYADCKIAFLGTDPARVSPAFATSNRDIEKQVADGKEAGKVKQLNFDPNTVPDDLASCKDKVIADCAEKVDPESPAPENADAGKTPTEDSTAADTSGSDESGSPTTRSPKSSTLAQSDSTGGGAPTGTNTRTHSPSSTTPTRTPAVAGGTSSSSKPAGAGSSTTTGSRAAGSTTSPDSDTTSDVDADGGLADQYADLITNSAGTSAPGIRPDGGRVQVTPITQQAVAGGGLAGQRDTNFGELEGRVVSLCVAGDLVCSMPPDSQIATDLVTFAQNVSVNFPDMLGSEGATRMGGLLALQALNMVTDTTGLPRTKLSAETLQALIDITAGAAMLAAENPAGTALIAKGVAKLPQAIPELFDQLKDVPAILEKLPAAPQTAAEKTGLDDVLARISTAFKDAGMENPLQIDKLPQAIPAVMTALVEDNTGLVQLVTNPQYWQADAHGQYPELKVAGSTGSIDWVAQWVVQLNKLATGGR